MSLSKVQVQNVVRQTVNDCGEKLNREQKWQVFINVCDNLLNEGRITTAQHSRWTLPF
jgi:sensor c-di-GMP phosphodiesterase-like protein|tara:strand:- start:377 stop:550 length:174 start_codon:yes stop_codon:yes gene_type:complete